MEGTVFPPTSRIRGIWPGAPEAEGLTKRTPGSPAEDGGSSKNLVTKCPYAGICKRVTRLERNANIAAVVIPFLGVVVAGVLLWNSLLGPRDLVILAALYVLTGLGVTVGFHRLLTHRAFQTRPWIRYTLAVLGSMSVQGPVIDWVADHRKHHTFADEDGDPHSPHAGHGAGLRGMVAGLWHAHVGWLFEVHGQASSKRFARDLLQEPAMRRINRSFPLIALASLVVPFLLGLILSGGSLVAGGLSALLWGGLVRIFLVHHVTWSINSICHFFGQRRFATEDESTNVFWLALPSLGEAWHHNHHAFPQSAFHGLRWYELDPSGWLILALARVGLAWDVERVTPERALAKLASSSPAPPQGAPAAADLGAGARIARATPDRAHAGRDDEEVLRAIETSSV
ncbi:MAG TPA: acyl-CoA desaturase [Solirubrobacteraceae bacterium]|nr:acyl-CoA desaturase [Solirubrobacteraceae bacterium]